jgi:hypothetical protein
MAQIAIFEEITDGTKAAYGSLFKNVSRPSVITPKAPTL